MTDMLPAETDILVVDDDPALLELLGKMLERIGVKPDTVPDGETALKHLYSKQTYDLLILDLMLPDIDGFSILEKLRDEARFDEMPVLILSARADPDTIKKGFDMGADGYLTKPYLPNTLTSRVRSILAQGRRKES